MPGIDTDLEALGLDALPARLARLLIEATTRLEAQAADKDRTSPESIARSVGVIARTGAALVVCVERLARLRAQRTLGDSDPTEEADMDDAEDAGAWRPDDQNQAYEAERLERRLRLLARNLHIPGGDDGGAGGDGAGAARGGAGELAGQCAGPPAAA